MNIYQWIKKIDWWLLTVSLLLSLFGLISLYSFTYGLDGGGLIFWKQLVALLLAGLLFYFFSRKNYRLWQSYGWTAYLISFVLLVAVLFFGESIRDVKSWFVIGPISWQPIELVKILLIVFLAKIFSQWSDYFFGLSKVIISGLAVFFLVILAMLQPDWGSAFILFAVWLVLLFFLPLRKWDYLLLFLVLIILAGVSWQWALQDYQKDRLISFVQPAADPLGQGYNLTQAKVAVGSGGFIGKGLTQGTQSQLRFLPVARTDFIFAMLAEELGWVGSVAVLSLFLILFYRLFKITRLANTSFGSLLSVGILIYLFVQMVVNVGMNLGLLPITGVPLPFVSSGGSSLLSSWLAVGLAESVFLYDS